MTGSLDLQEVLNLSFAAIRRLLDFGGGSIQLIEEGMLELAATEPRATAEALTVRIPVGQGVSGTIAATGEPIYIPDILEDSRVHPVGRVKATSPGVRSWFGAPLILSGSTIGVVQIDSPRVDAFTEETRALMLAFCPTIAASVQNALLFRRELAALGELREAERLKSDFLAVITHELRTPITSIVGFAETLSARAGSLDPPLIEEFARRIADSGRRLRRMIDDLLDISQVERGALGVEMTPTDVSSVIGSTVLEAGVDGHMVSLLIDEGLPLVLADPGRLQQVLVNLVGNAAKFSPPGSPIEIRARAEEDRVAVSVVDHGPGIPAPMRERIFERFFQVEPASTRAVGGIGIGLYLVKILCDRMKVEVRLDTEVGKGSSFTVRLRTAD